MARKATATALASAAIVWFEKADASDGETTWALLIALTVYMCLHTATDIVAMVYGDKD